MEMQLCMITQLKNGFFLFFLCLSLLFIQMYHQRTWGRRRRWEWARKMWMHSVVENVFIINYVAFFLRFPLAVFFSSSSFFLKWIYLFKNGRKFVSSLEIEDWRLKNAVFLIFKMKTSFFNLSLSKLSIAFLFEFCF